MNQAAIRERINDMLTGGQLPRRAASRINAAYGDGRRCHICEEATAPSDVTYELHVNAAGELRSIFLHFACFDLWERERAVAQAADAAG
jgi:hypothetical protein